MLPCADGADRLDVVHVRRNLGGARPIPSHPQGCRSEPSCGPARPEPVDREREHPIHERHEQKEVPGRGRGRHRGHRGGQPVRRGGAGRHDPRGKSAANEPVVAYVQDPKAGVLHLMVGEREVIVEDHDLVARILNAAEASEMSSHREAPEISKDPVADSTDDGYRDCWLPRVVHDGFEHLINIAGRR